MVGHSVETPADTNRAQRLDRVLSGCLRNPVCPKSFRISLPSLLIRVTRLFRCSPSLPFRRKIKSDRQHYEMFLLVGGSV